MQIEKQYLTYTLNKRCVFGVEEGSVIVGEDEGQVVETRSVLAHHNLWLAATKHPLLLLVLSVSGLQIDSLLFGKIEGNLHQGLDKVQIQQCLKQADDVGYIDEILINTPINADNQRSIPLSMLKGNAHRNCSRIAETSFRITGTFLSKGITRLSDTSMPAICAHSCGQCIGSTSLALTDSACKKGTLSPQKIETIRQDQNKATHQKLTKT